MGTVVGDAIRQRMAEAEDEPLSHEWTEVRDFGSHESRVAKAWGRKGLYVASPDGGDWTAAGPFADGEG